MAVAAVALAVAVAAFVVPPLLDAFVANFASRAYDEALRGFEHGDYRATVTALERVPGSGRVDFSSRVLLGRAYLRLGYAEQAEQALHTALRAGADAAVVSVPLARAYLEEGKLDRLFAELPANVADPQLRGRLLVVHGLAYLEERDLDRAEQSFETAAALLPKEPGPLLGRARVALARERVDEAATLAQTARARAPDDPGVWQVEGDVRRRRGDRTGAIAAYGEAIARDPGYLPALRARAALLVASDRDDAALADLHTVWSMRPDDPQADFEYALVLAKRGDLERAQEVIERAALGLMSYRSEFLARHPPSLLLMGLLKVRNGRYDEAARRLERYLKIEPHDVGARTLLARAALARRDPARAIEVLGPALGAAPHDPEVIALLAEAYRRHAEPARAQALVRAAATVAPRPHEWRTALALARLSMRPSDTATDGASAPDLGDARGTTGFLAAALQLAHGAVEDAVASAGILAHAAPDSAAVANLLGVAERAAGERAPARAALERAIAIDAGFAPAQRNLARLEADAGDVPGARARLERVLGRDAHDVRAMLELAALARRERRLADATRWLEKARTADPTDLAPQLELIQSYVDENRMGDARALAQSLAERFPHSARARLARARVAGRGAPR